MIIMTTNSPQQETSKKPNFLDIAEKLAIMTAVKNEKYGNSFNEAHEILKVLYPDGVKPEDYKNMLGIVRVLDKLFRLSKGDQGDESAWRDIAGYGLLGEKNHQTKIWYEEQYKKYYEQIEGVQLDEN